MLKPPSKNSKLELLQKISQPSTDSSNALKLSRENSTNNLSKGSNSTLLKPQHKSTQNSRTSSSQKITDLSLKRIASKETSPSKMAESTLLKGSSIIKPKLSLKQKTIQMNEGRPKSSSDLKVKQSQLTNQSQQQNYGQQKQTSVLKKETNLQGHRSTGLNKLNKSVNSNSSSRKISPQNKDILFIKQKLGSSQSQIEQQSQELLQQNNGQQQLKLNDQEQIDLIQYQDSQQDINQSEDNLIIDQSKVQQQDGTLNEGISEQIQNQYNQIQQSNNYSEQLDTENDEDQYINQYQLENQQLIQASEKLKYLSNHIQELIQNDDDNQSNELDTNQVNNQEIDLKINSVNQKVKSQLQIESLQIDKTNYQINQLLLTEGDKKQNQLFKEIKTFSDQIGERLNTIQEDIQSNDAISQIQFNDIADGDTSDIVITHRTNDAYRKNSYNFLRKQSQNASSSKFLEIVIQDDQIQIQQIQSAKAQLYSQQFQIFNQNDRNLIQEDTQVNKKEINYQIEQDIGIKNQLHNFDLKLINDPKNNLIIQQIAEKQQSNLISNNSNLDQDSIKINYQVETQSTFIQQNLTDNLQQLNGSCINIQNEQKQQNMNQDNVNKEIINEDINLINIQQQYIEKDLKNEFQTYYNQLPQQSNNIDLSEHKNQDIGSIYFIQQKNKIIQEQEYKIQGINLNQQELKQKQTQNKDIKDQIQNEITKINRNDDDVYNQDLDHNDKVQRDNINQEDQQLNENNNKYDNYEENSQGSKKSRITNNQEIINNSSSFHQNETDVDFNFNDIPSQRTQEFGETQRDIENEIEQLSDSQKQIIIKKDEIQPEINNVRFQMTLNLQNLQGQYKHYKDDQLDTGRTDDSMINQLVAQDRDLNSIHLVRHNSETKPLFKMKKQHLYINDIIQEKQESATPDNYTRSINPTPKPGGSTKHQKNLYSFGVQEDLRFRQGEQIRLSEKEIDKDRRKKEYQQQKKLQIQSEKLDDEKIKELQKILSSKLEIKQQKESRILEQSLKIMEFQYTLDHIPDIQDLDGNIDSFLSNIINEFIDCHKRNRYKNISNMKDPQLADLMRNKFQEILKKEEQKQQQDPQIIQQQQILDTEIKQKQQIQFMLQLLFQEYKLLKSKSLELNQEYFVSQQKIYEKMKKLSIREILIPQLKQLDIDQNRIINDYKNSILSQDKDFNENELIRFIQSEIKIQQDIHHCIQDIRNIFKERINQIKEGEQVMQEQLLQNSQKY
ncbi:unnamed protein product [Paramecium pentaurelia]|uniref:Uncharacterized protein n=1 Tax=Paramecium pentaurelia TaxID=43138 RepID=A0A8S1T900_9CILI|nr:unnamed protein product [Paramecium pentaurelia]